MNPHQITLWSFQPLEVAAALEKGETIHAAPDFERDWGQLPSHAWGFRQAYEWMREQMVARIGPPTAKVGDPAPWPMWAWARPPSATSRGAPDLRSMPQSKECALIELRASRSEVLLSDHGSWHHVLNGWPNALTQTESDRLEADAKNLAAPSAPTIADPRVFRIYEPTWTRIFKVEPFELGAKAHMSYGEPADADWAYLLDVSVQATMWAFEPRHFVSWRPVKGSKKGYLP